MVQRLPYQHGYHAGNFADVAKHSVLLLLLQHMQRKASPYVYVDTHAGAGAYNLAGAVSSQLMEHQRGIQMLAGSSSMLPPSAAQLVSLLPDSGDTYLGSPMIAQTLCRSQDSLILCENAPDQYRLLEESIGDDSRATLLLDDGYKALARKDVRQPQHRALVFIDPPYQFGSDTERIAALVGELRCHWRSARVAIWLPLRERERARAERLYASVVDAVSTTSPADILAAELCCSEAAGVGSGILMVNPPYGIDSELEELLPALGGLMSAEGEMGAEGASVRWLSKS